MARTIEEDRARAKIIQIESSVRRCSHRRWPSWMAVAFLGAGLALTACEPDEPSCEDDCNNSDSQLYKMAGIRDEPPAEPGEVSRVPRELTPDAGVDLEDGEDD
ncbi:MAG: hypothetical protein CVU65_18615 [Deltaproteobacteria bacterium HGW-Deltaproteobacteria-22]|nr:MAG: hypothetical protein CVU65_18615 [Deltaproteobacteria bacterium HGW-Deltaproteobacteria-22]